MEITDHSATNVKKVDVMSCLTIWNLKFNFLMTSSYHSLMCTLFYQIYSGEIKHDLTCASIHKLNLFLLQRITETTKLKGDTGSSQTHAALLMVKLDSAKHLPVSQISDFVLAKLSWFPASMTPPTTRP